MIRIIIDGYNLIFQCGFHPKNLDSALALHRARQRLLDELADRIESSDRHEVMIIFDAKNPKGETTPELIRKGFKIAFARDYEDADAMVIELIRKHSQPRRLTVASNDHRIQTAATRRKAIAIDSDVWFDSLKLIRGDDDRAIGELSGDQLLTKSETQKLIEEFTFPENPTESGPPKVSKDSETDSFYNPFPPGYGDDLTL